MKKVILSFFLAVIMVIPMAGAANMEPTEADLGNDLEIHFIPESSDSSDESGNTEDNQDSPQPKVVPRVEPVGLWLYPLVYDEVEGAVPYSGTHLYFPPTGGQNFISRHVWISDQNRLISETLNAGKIPVGWYMETAYDVSNVYEPIRWEINTWSAVGTSQLMTHPASNGRTVFSLRSYFADETTPYYDFGIKGHILYRLAPGDNIVRIPIQLTVDFVSYDKPNPTT